jgi:hypothetical protein
VPRRGRDALGTAGRMPDYPDQATMEQYDMDEPKLGTQKKTLLLAAPHGLEGIVASFGNIYDYIQPGGSLDSRWQADCLARWNFPSPCRFPGIFRRACAG